MIYILPLFQASHAFDIYKKRPPNTQLYKKSSCCMLTCLPIKTGPAPLWLGANSVLSPYGAPCITQLLFFCSMLLKRRHYYYRVIIYFSFYQILLGASKFGSFGVNCAIFWALGYFILSAARQVANWQQN